MSRNRKDSQESTVIDAGIDLSPQQETAILALLSGEPQRRAAEIAGVTQETLSRWMNHDELFLKVYAGRRADVWKAHEVRLAELTGHAIATLEQLMRPVEYTGSDIYDPKVRLQAAIAVLRLTMPEKFGSRVLHIGAAQQVNVGEQQVIAGER